MKRNEKGPPSTGQRRHQCKGPGVGGLSAGDATAQEAEGELQKMQLKREVGTRIPKAWDHGKDTGLHHKNPGNPLEGLTREQHQLDQGPTQNNVSQH